MTYFDNDVVAKTFMVLLEPIDGLKAYCSHLLTLYKDKLVVLDVLRKTNVEISVNQIKNVVYGTKAEINKNTKSNNLFKAFVSALNDKNKQVFLIIIYVNKEGNEIHIKLEDKNLEGKMFYKRLQELINTDNK